MATATPLVPLGPTSVISLSAGGAEYDDDANVSMTTGPQVAVALPIPGISICPVAPGWGPPGSPVAAAPHAAYGVEKLFNPESPPSQSLFENP